jgi:hypothetical protein
LVARPFARVTLFRKTAHKLFRPLAGWLCVCVYLTLGAQLLPGFVTLAVSLDDDHTITTVAEGDHVELILHHDESDGPAAEDYGHDHGLAETIVMLVAGAGSRHGDHVVRFAKPVKQAAAGAAVTVAKPVEVSGSDFPAWSVALAQPLARTEAGSGARPPPLRTAAPFARRSTSLVI